MTMIVSLLLTTLLGQAPQSCADFLEACMGMYQEHYRKDMVSCGGEWKTGFSLCFLDYEEDIEEGIDPPAAKALRILCEEEAIEDYEDCVEEAASQASGRMAACFHMFRECLDRRN